jgi:diadenosine tetraphosphatase ApaH/serine/threonine PP2A family protein phosphatase
MTRRIALIGGIYSNHLALTAALGDIRSRGIDEIFCLGDLGAFGPNPDRAIDLIRAAGVRVIQGNYDNSIGNGLDDCQCGYTDPRDNYYAKLSYDYTFRNTGDDHKRWMKSLPAEHRLTLGSRRVLLCHGSPRKMNEFLWESTTPTHHLEKLCDDFGADLIAATHTGIHWRRDLPSGRAFVNVGVLGRPENDGTPRVWYTILSDAGDPVEFVPVAYNHQVLADEMRAEGLPIPFVETILEGWWTTCLEVLPARERSRGRY